MSRGASVEAFVAAETSPAKLERGDFAPEDLLYREYRLWAFHQNARPVGIKAFRSAMDKLGVQREPHELAGGRRWTWRIEQFDEETYTGRTIKHRVRVPYSEERGEGPHFVYLIRLNDERSWVTAPVYTERRRAPPVVARRVRVLRDVQYAGETLAAGTVVDQMRKRKHEEHRPDAEEIVIEWKGIRRWIDARLVALAEN